MTQNPVQTELDVQPGQIKKGYRSSNRTRNQRIQFHSSRGFDPTIGNVNGSDNEGLGSIGGHPREILQ
jgi:hypothetical protein